MNDVAKLSKSGGSQPVRLPKGYRFEGESEVLIDREGPRVVLESRKAAWSERFLERAGNAPESPIRSNRAVPPAAGRGRAAGAARPASRG